MSKKQTPQSVDDLIVNLNHPLNDVITRLRKLVLKTHPSIVEKIKWNSPAYYYTGEMKPFNPKEYKDCMVVFHLNKKDKVLLVLPSGNRIPLNSMLGDENLKDGRKLITLTNLDQLIKNEKFIKAVFQDWINTID